MIILCAVSLWASVIAQDVFDSSIPIEPPKPADAEVVDTIRKALSDGPEAQHVNDPILDDVLQVINERGSILDGSSLSPKTNTESFPPTEAASKALTAERLLKAARLLERIEPQDHSRRALVKQMRRETVRLLSE